MDADTIEYRPSESPDFESDDYLEHLAISLLPDINSEDYQNENADEDEDDYDYYGDQQYQHDQVMDADDGSSSVMEMQDVLESTPNSLPEDLLRKRFTSIARSASVTGRYYWNHPEEDDLSDQAHDTFLEWDPQAEMDEIVDETVDETVEDIPPTDIIILETPEPSWPRKYRNALEQAFMEAHLDDHLFRLSCRILDAELNGPRSPLHRLVLEGRQTIKGKLVEMLASADWDIVRACIIGDLPLEIRKRRSHAGEAVRSLTDDSAPGIYSNYITDSTGLSPTAEQYLDICDDLELYSSMSFTAGSNLWRATIDQAHRCPASWTIAQNQAGFARYLDWWPIMVKKNGQHSKKRREVVARFVKELRERCMGLVEKGLGRRPLHPPLVEIGYSIHPASRLRQHASHHSSNYLMNLTEALLKERYNGGFGLTQGVLFRVWDPLHPWLAEIAFTQLAQGYISQAGGFSHFPAGFSNSSAWKTLSMAQWEELAPEGEENEHLVSRINWTARRMEEEEKTLKPLTELVEAVEGFADALEACLGTGKGRSYGDGDGFD